MVLTAVAIQIPELEEGVYIAEKMKAQAEIALAKAKEVAQAQGVDRRGDPGHRRLARG